MISNLSSTGQSDNWKEKAGRIGHIAKGAVYGIAGVLTLLAAFNMGGQKAGKIQVIEFLEKQPFGNVLLVLLALGLACYAFWRFVQSIQDPQNKGNDTKGKIMRAGYFISGLIYLGFGIYAISQVMGSGGGSGQSRQSVVAKLLASGDFGVFVVVLISIALFAKAVYQFYRVYDGSFAKNIRTTEIPHHKAQSIVRKAGYAGYISRGVLIGLVAYFFLKAAMEHNPSAVQGQSGAFSFLQQSSSGPWLMAIIAAGLVCYGVFMIIAARYKNFSAK